MYVEREPRPTSSAEQEGALMTIAAIIVIIVGGLLYAALHNGWITEFLRQLSH